jgi:hypothetical protein
MVAVGGKRCEENQARRVAKSGFGDGEALRGRQQRRDGDDKNLSGSALLNLPPFSSPQGDSAGRWVTEAAQPADLRTFSGILPRKWYLEPADCRLGVCGERKCFSDDQSAARSRLTSLPLSTLLPHSLVRTPSRRRGVCAVWSFPDTVARAPASVSGDDLSPATWPAQRLNG